MKRLLPVIACSLLSLAGCGASTEPATDDTTVSVDVSGSAKPTDSTQAPSTLSPEDQLAWLTGRYQEKNDTFMASYRSAKTLEARNAALKLRPKAEDFTEQFLRLAEAFPDSEAAIDALIWVSETDRGESGNTAKSKLLTAYTSSPKILPIVYMMMYDSSDRAEPQLRGLLRNSDKAVRGTATFALGSLLMRKDEGSIEARELLQSVVDDFADVSFEMQGASDFRIASKAEGALFGLNYLQIGMEAPDIEGPDLDGVDFKLSDYRGKVVLLDFWGNW